jgi:hypothetical protein
MGSQSGIVPLAVPIGCQLAWALRLKGDFVFERARSSAAERGTLDPLFMPANISIDDQRVQFELTRYLSDNWERTDFERLYGARADDWRPVLSGPQPATDRLMRPDFGAPPVLA